MDLGYERAEDSVSRMEFSDNWIRSFKDSPDFSDGEKDMMHAFVDKCELSKLAIYLSHPKFGYELDPDMAEFVIREIIRGAI